MEAEIQTLIANEEFKGVRILVVEDEPMICLLLEDILADLGCEVIGPALDIDRAMELVERHVDIDTAILDVNLGGRSVLPVAEVLSKRGVPFLFATGLNAEGLPQDWQDHSIIRKPMTATVLADALRRTLAAQ
jgi:CheY-like chemotaxis protein